MGLFKGKEEKNTAKEEKKREAINNILKYYELEDIDARDKENIDNIAETAAKLNVLA